MVRIAVVGNRDGWSKEFVFRVLQQEGIKPDDVIVSGGAFGVDSWVEEFARTIKCKMVIHRPDMQVAFPYRFHQRNKKIAKDCERMIAFDKKQRSGTSQTIRFARELGKDVRVISNEKETKENSN